MPLLNKHECYDRVLRTCPANRHILFFQNHPLTVVRGHKDMEGAGRTRADPGYCEARAQLGKCLDRMAGRNLEG